jgi:hypothetical protein
VMLSDPGQAILSARASAALPGKLPAP